MSELATAANFTTEQATVVSLPVEAHALVSAAAGTGKTHALAGRLTHLVESEGLSAGDELLVLSFSRAAVAELRRRIGRALVPSFCLVTHLSRKLLLPGVLVRRASFAERALIRLSTARGQVLKLESPERTIGPVAGHLWEAGASRAIPSPSGAWDERTLRAARLPYQVQALPPHSIGGTLINLTKI